MAGAVFLFVPLRSIFSSLALRRVRIKYSNLKKHALPVDASCPWSHVNGIPSYEEGCNTFGEGSEPVKSYADLRSCMQESPCRITGTPGIRSWLARLFYVGPPTFSAPPKQEKRIA